MSYSIPTRSTFGGFGAVDGGRFLPANPFAVPMTVSDDGTVRAAAADCGPGMVREPLLGQCLPSGSDPTKCPPGMVYKAGVGCVFIPQGTGCPPGTQSDPLGISCFPTNIPGTQPTQPTAGGGCPTGYAKDPILGTSCLPTSWPVPGIPGQGLPTAAGCLLGQVKDANGACVFPFCPPNQTYNLTTGSCDPAASSTGYDIVRQACDLLPAALRPASCGAPSTTSTPAGTSSTGGANLALLCGLIPAGWPTVPGCPSSGGAATGGGTPSPVRPGTTVPASQGLGMGSALLALAGVALVGAGAVYVAKRAKKGRR